MPLWVTNQIWNLIYPTPRVIAYTEPTSALINLFLYIRILMKYFSLLAVLMVTGCASTTGTDFINSSIQTITNEFSKAMFGSPTVNMDKDGWVRAYTVPKDNPEYHIDINKPSIKKYGNKVEYVSRTVYVSPEYIPATILAPLKGTTYTPAPGDYVSSTIIVDCSNKTYGLHNSAFYSYDNQKLMYCPWLEKSKVPMKEVSSGSIIEHTVKSASK